MAKIQAPTSLYVKWGKENLPYRFIGRTEPEKGREKRPDDTGHVVALQEVTLHVSNREMKFPAWTYIPVSSSSFQPGILTEIVSSACRTIYH